MSNFSTPDKKLPRQHSTPTSISSTSTASTVIVDSPTNSPNNYTNFIELKTKQIEEKIRKNLEEEREAYGKTPPTVRAELDKGNRICEKRAKKGKTFYSPVTTEKKLSKRKKYYNCDEPHGLIERKALFMGGKNRKTNRKTNKKRKSSKNK